MADSKDIVDVMEDEYDEEADSDFEVADNKDDVVSSSCEDSEGGAELPDTGRPKKRRKITKAAPKAEDLGELDSGDEATIRELEKAKRKQKREGQLEEDDSEGEETGWRAKTRAMRERDKEEKKKNKLATTKGSTIDVDKLWEEMNRPGGPVLPPHSTANEDESTGKENDAGQGAPKPRANAQDLASMTKAAPESQGVTDDMITIKRTYEFAGEVHIEVKTVPKSSAEARLWLSQQSSKDSQATGANARPLRRPLRKISRFDPNLNNLESIKRSWEMQYNVDGTVKGHKLNTVEKSKMDWAAHVDQEGLKEELDEHAKAKEGYLGRMDFLGQVEQRREEEARISRLKG